MNGASRSPLLSMSIWLIVTFFLLFVPPLLVYKMKTTKSKPVSLNSLSAPMASKSVQPPIEKTVSEKTIEYKMYGRVVRFGNETPDGIMITFVLDADPVQTVMAGVVRPQAKTYELVRYDTNFEKSLAVERVLGKDLVLQALSTPRSLELGLTFPKVGPSAEDESRMKDLDSIIAGNWKSMPTQRLEVRSIGIRSRM